MGASPKPSRTCHSMSAFTNCCQLVIINTVRIYKIQYLLPNNQASKQSPMGICSFCNNNIIIDIRTSYKNFPVLMHQSNVCLFPFQTPHTPHTPWRGEKQEILMALASLVTFLPGFCHFRCRKTEHIYLVSGTKEHFRLSFCLFLVRKRLIRCISLWFEQFMT